MITIKNRETLAQWLESTNEEIVKKTISLCVKKVLNREDEISIEWVLRNIPQEEYKAKERFINELFEQQSYREDWEEFVKLLPQLSAYKWLALTWLLKALRALRAQNQEPIVNYLSSEILKDKKNEWLDEINRSNLAEAEKKNLFHELDKKLSPHYSSLPGGAIRNSLKLRYSHYWDSEEIMETLELFATYEQKDLTLYNTLAMIDPYSIKRARERMHHLLMVIFQKYLETYPNRKVEITHFPSRCVIEETIKVLQELKYQGWLQEAASFASHNEGEAWFVYKFVKEKTFHKGDLHAIVQIADSLVHDGYTKQARELMLREDVRELYASGFDVNDAERVERLCEDPLIKWGISGAGLDKEKATLLHDERFVDKVFDSFAHYHNPPIEGEYAELIYELPRLSELICHKMEDASTPRECIVEFRKLVKRAGVTFIPPKEKEILKQLDEELA